MAEDTKDTPETGAAGQAPDATNTPSFAIVGQYIRDLSFENPNAPGSLVAAAQKPGSNVNINVQVKKQSDEVYASEIGINVKTEHEGKVVYAVELVYGGLFRVKNVPENQLGALLMVEAPRLIFPFARQVLAQTIQQGGFAPLMLEPVDFLSLYRRNLQAATERQKQQAGQDAGEEAKPTVN
ncbi:protein-export chaperone SecB [Pelagibacterium xiamenense]|uniref:protein-export chaperone SecB n=1 Tax=Pelagibacterium xiamenense TaxID=2901140 RepID=UPI001E3F96EF|nr:protein-export chaperone SecB [Pelagibacterium xiamenense]MCD7058432.1 protein-export chaperone SecB [Pelagibacterium xiamenense]